MEELASTTTADAHGVTVHIVSPSSEVPNKLTLPNLDKKLTLGELKQKIQDSASSKPSPARQRLIYRARPLIRDDMTLQEIFGSLEVHNPDGYTLHLVLPPSPTAVSQTFSIAGSQGSASHLSSTHPPPRPASTGQIPPGFTSRPYVAAPGSNNAPAIVQQRTNAASMQNPALRMGQLPPEMRQAMNYHFASLGGPWPPHIGPQGAVSHPGNPFWQAQAQAPSHPHFHPQASLHPMPHFMTPQVQHMIAHQQQLRAAMGAHGAGDSHALSHAAPNPGNTSNVAEQQLPVPVGPPPIFPNHGPPARTIVQEGRTPDGGHWRMIINGPSAQIPTIHFHNHEMLPTNHQVSQTNHIPASYPGINQAGINTLTPQSSSSTMMASTVYLLSSPQGPQALLVSPQGTYITPGLNVSPSPLSSAQSHANTGSTQSSVMNPPEPTNERRRVIQVVNHGRADRAQEAGADAARDLVRILLPLGGHLWLLLRLFGFVWFFMGGADWRRTFLVMAAAILVFLSQTAAFRPLVHAIWEPIRRHVESLVPLGVENSARRGGPENGRQPESNPRPEDLAARLLRERNEQDQSLLSRSFRRAERATALFVASLVPGVGERHIAARDAAVAARLAAEREQEEQRRSREESARDDQDANPLTEGQDCLAGGQKSAEHPNTSTQPPAIEI